VLVIEHLNSRDIPGYLVPTPADAASLVDEIGSERVRLLYDAYHAAMEGLDPASDIRNHASLLAHVHYSELPARHPPTNALWRFISSLEDIGYRGSVGLEYFPDRSSPRPLVPVADDS
jgi:hydroxypyruvate isomerase